MSATPSSPDAQSLREGLALAFVPKVGPVRFRELVERYGGAQAAFAESVRRAERADALECADAYLSAAANAGARVLLFGEAEYPERLLDLPDPPSLFSVLGDTAALTGPAVSIVGTRNASAEGTRTASRLAGALAAAGAAIVSGMALGIDAAAHEGALDAGGRTVAVLGGGVDVPYPPSHRALHARIAAHGLHLSEAMPGRPPHAGAFPRRNRLIAALGQALVVVEAGSRSGALITADIALDLGRSVGAVPGSVESPRTAGSIQLLREGAVLVAEPEDALVLAGLVARPVAEAGPVARARRRRAARASATRVAVRPVAPLDFAEGTPERLLLEAVRAGAGDIDDIARVTRLSTRNALAALASLEVAGVLGIDPAGNIRLVG